MKTINVDSSAIAIPSYRSPTEAIERTRDSRAARARADSSKVAGAQVSGFSISDDAIRLDLSDDRSLEIFITDRQVDWRIVRGPEGPRSSATYQAKDLIWQSGRRLIWDPAAVLDMRVSSRISGMSAGPVFFNVYFAAKGALQFLPLWNRTDQIVILYFSEIEPTSNRSDSNGASHPPTVGRP